MLKQFFTLTITLIFLATLNGCGGGPDDAPETGEVSGTVTLDGNPLPNANVFFQAGKSKPAYAVTDADGKYNLTHGSQTGAVIGENLVTISSAEPVESEYGADDKENGASDETGGEGDEKDVDPKIPAKYNTEAASNPDMKVEVKAGSNTFDFPLKSTE